jgi:hypothetical protein
MSALNLSEMEKMFKINNDAHQGEQSLLKTDVYNNLINNWNNIYDNIANNEKDKLKESVDKLITELQLNELQLNDKKQMDCQVRDDKRESFSSTSANCIHKIEGGNFKKVQLYDLTDPLLNEVIITRVLTNLKEQNELFPRYVDHGLIKLDVDQKPLQYLTTTVLNNFVPLYDFLFNNANNQITTEFIAKIHTFMDNYAQVCEEIQLVHNDLHLNNIVIIHNNNDYSIKLIDFGRSSIDYAGNVDIITTSFEKFCIVHNKTNFENIITNNKALIAYSIKGEKCYLCDLATLSLHMLLAFPKLRLSTYVTITGMNVQLKRPQPNELSDDANWFSRSLAFLSLFVFNAAPLFSDAPVNNIMNINLSKLFGKYLGTNGVFKPSVFQKDIKESTIVDYLRSFQRNNLTKTRGGQTNETDQLNVNNILKAPSKQQLRVRALNDDPVSKIIRQCRFSSHKWLIPDILTSLYTKSMLPQTTRCQKSALTNMHTTRFGNEIGCGAAGGSQQHAYKIHTERKTGRKYVTFRGKFYLDENRGRFKYATKDKSSIQMRSKSK